MKRIVIIGYGDLSREDDGVGRLAAERLAVLCTDPRVMVIACHQLISKLVEQVSTADCVLFIDAAKNGIPGVVSLTRVMPAELPPVSFSNRMDPSALLASCGALYGRVPEAVRLTVSGEQFDDGEQLSPVVAEVLPNLVDRVRAMVESECRADEDKERDNTAPSSALMPLGKLPDVREPTPNGIQ